MVVLKEHLDFFKVYDTDVIVFPVLTNGFWLIVKKARPEAKPQAIVASSGRRLLDL